MLKMMRFSEILQICRSFKCHKVANFHVANVAVPSNVVILRKP